MKRLVILANAFPFGTWEPFLMTELAYAKGFDAIHIVSLSVRDEQRKTRRALPDESIKVHPIRFMPKWFYALRAPEALLRKDFWEELSFLRRSKRLSFRNLVTLLVFFSRSSYEAHAATRALKADGVSAHDKIVVYSYRTFYQPYMAHLMKRSLKIVASVARSHRADLYEEASPTRYLPLRQKTIDIVDKIYCIADSGVEYWHSKTNDPQHKVIVHRLGTQDFGQVNAVNLESEELRIVSCSTLTPVKRVHLLAQALGKLNRPLNWQHFGKGSLLSEVKAECQALPQSAQVTFRGFVPNTDVVASYVEHPAHVFVNVSSSEGVPVSIMEALSTGTPVVATDVGGTGELVKNGNNGFLLPADCTPADIAEALNRIASMSDRDYAALRARARASWERMARADSLYPAFWKELSAY